MATCARGRDKSVSRAPFVMKCNKINKSNKVDFFSNYNVFVVIANLTIYWLPVNVNIISAHR